MEKRRNELLQVLVASSTISVVLCIARMFWMDSYQFGFLLWNLFLAWIPFIIAHQMKLQQRKWIHYTLFLCWLPFLPNAPYMVTDLVHLHHYNGKAMYWFDMFLIFSFAWNGLILGFLSLNRIHNLFHYYFSKRVSWLLVFVLINLCGYGIYLGRFDRYNSWDIISNPVGLFSNIYFDFRHPMHNLDALGFSLFISTFIMIFYLTLVVFKNQKTSDSFVTALVHQTFVSSNWPGTFAHTARELGSE